MRSLRDANTTLAMNKKMHAWTILNGMTAVSWAAGLIPIELAVGHGILITACALVAFSGEPDPPPKKKPLALRPLE